MTELVARMSSFKGLLGNNNKKTKREISNRKKQNWILHGPPDTGILVKYVFELRRTCPNYW